MEKYLFNEEILREDRRSGTYMIKFIIISVILFLISAGIWFYTKIPKIPDYVNLFFSKIQLIWAHFNFTPPKTVTLQIIISIIFGVAGIIVIICGAVGLSRARLVLTPKRVCLLKGKRNYKEARFDKIESIRIKRSTLILYTSDRKIKFGPIPDAFGTRDAIVFVMTKCRNEDNDSRQTRCSEPEPYTKSGDVFDGEKI